MDITKGSLDDISRPASSERFRPGSRVSSVVFSEEVRMSQDRMGALEVLSSELAETQRIEENNLNCPSKNLAFYQDVSEDDNEDPELQKAIIKMRRLDKVLETIISNEKEVKKQGRELHQRLWQELKDHEPEKSPEWVDEEENTRLFLALTSNNFKDCAEEVNCVPVFETQVPKQINDLNCRSGKIVNPEIKEVKKTESRQCVTGKNKHRQDFIKKNIELVSSTGSLGVLTQEEKKRLDELLKDIDEDENSVDQTAKPETDSLCVVSMTPDEGYKPQATELEQLLQIDAKLQLLIPVEEFLSVRGPYGFHSFSQVKEAAELGERALQDMKESSEQEQRLREIQQQLQLLTKSAHPDTFIQVSDQCQSLTEEQRKSLLLECEMAWRRSSDLGTQGFSDSKPYFALDGQIMSLLASTPRLSSSALSEYILEACETPISPVLELSTLQQEAQVNP